MDAEKQGQPREDGNGQPAECRGPLRGAKEAGSHVTESLPEETGVSRR